MNFVYPSTPVYNLYIWMQMNLRYLTLYRVLGMFPITLIAPLFRLVVAGKVSNHVLLARFA